MAAANLRARSDVDPGRVGIWRVSNGGYLTQLSLARNSDLFAAGVSECGIYDWTTAAARPNPSASTARDSSAVGCIDRWTSPVLIIHGDDDDVVDFNSQTVALARGLRARGVPFEQLVFPDGGHCASLGTSMVWAHALKAQQATADFLVRLLGRQAPPR